MDGLSSASAVFAVVSVAIQLAETIHKLVEFWKAVEDAPDNVAGIFRELGLLSKILTQSHELAQRHSFSDTFDEALKDCHSKIIRLYSKIHDTRSDFKSSRLRRRKWAAWKIVMNKTEIDSLQKSISEAKSTILLVQLNSLLARPPSIPNVYQSIQETSHFNTQVFETMRIAKGQRANGLTVNQNLSTSLRVSDEKLLALHSNATKQHFVRQKDGEKAHQSMPGYGENFQYIEVGSRKRLVYGSKGRLITGPFSDIWTLSQGAQERVIHASGVNENAQTESQVIVYPSKWLAKIGMVYGFKFSALASRGWQYSFQPFRAVPESALIFQFCREGNLSGVRTLLSRRDASPYDRDPLGRTPLWYAALHHQVGISSLLLSEGADAQARDWRNGRKPIENIYFGVCNDIKVKLELANLLANHDFLEDDVNYWAVGRLLTFYRPSRMMDLDVTKRNEAVLAILQYLTPFFHRTNYNFSGLLSDLLKSGYDGPILPWVLRNISGKLHIDSNESIVQGALRMLLWQRDPPTMKNIIDKSTPTDLHLYIDPSPSQVYRRETPTSLAMHDWEGFSAWRRLLVEAGIDMSDFITQELEAGGLKSDGWTHQTLSELFQLELKLPKLPQPLSRPDDYHPCERCRQPTYHTELNKVDLEWRRKLRYMRTKEPLILDPLPYRIVCPRNCEDGICVAWEFENSEPPNFPPYVPKDERIRLEQLRLLEEEARCPTYFMPGAFEA